MLREDEARCSVCRTVFHTFHAKIRTGGEPTFGYSTCSQECARVAGLHATIMDAAHVIERAVAWVANQRG